MREPLISNKYNFLTVLERDYSRKNHTYYLCKCDCGTVKSIRKDDLIHNATKSCGCKKKELHYNALKIRTNTKWLLESSPEKSYFIGLLISDGYISKNNQIGVQLIESDGYLLERLSNFIFGFNNVKTVLKKYEQDFKRHNQKRLVFTDPDFLKYLKSLGFCTSKTLNAVIPVEYLTDKDFWRGMIDGDGCVSVSSNMFRLSLVGTENVCFNFKEFCNSIGSTSNSKIYKKGSPTPLFEYSLSGKNAKLVYKYLYTNSTISLNRKQLFLTNEIYLQ